MQKNTIIRFYYPENIKVENLVDVVESIESCTNEKLMFTADANNKPLKVTDRPQWLREVLSDPQKLPFLANGSKEPVISASVHHYPQILYANTALKHVIVSIPETLRTIENLFKMVQGMEINDLAYWGAVYPPSVSFDVALQSQPTYEPSKPSDLQKLEAPMNYSTPYMPANLGWLNYWSDETLGTVQIGLQKLRSLFHRVEVTENGAILQLTDDKCMDNKEALLKKLKQVYEEIPFVGGRYP